MYSHPVLEFYIEPEPNKVTQLIRRARRRLALWVGPRNQILAFPRGNATCWGQILDVIVEQTDDIQSFRWEFPEPKEDWGTGTYVYDPVTKNWTRDA